MEFTSLKIPNPQNCQESGKDDLLLYFHFRVQNPRQKRLETKYCNYTVQEVIYQELQDCNLIVFYTIAPGVYFSLMRAFFFCRKDHSRDIGHIFIPFHQLAIYYFYQSKGSWRNTVTVWILRKNKAIQVLNTIFAFCFTNYSVL